MTQRVGGGIPFVTLKKRKQNLDNQNEIDISNSPPTAKGKIPLNKDGDDDSKGYDPNILYHQGGLPDELALNPEAFIDDIDEACSVTSSQTLVLPLKSRNIL